MSCADAELLDLDLLVHHCIWIDGLWKMCLILSVGDGRGSILLIGWLSMVGSLINSISTTLFWNRWIFYQKNLNG